MKKIIILLIFFANFILANDFDKALRAYEGNKFSKAYELFAPLCEKNSARSCFSMAYMHEQGQGVSKDLQKAYKLYEKACKLRLGKACVNLGILQKNSGFENEAILSFNQACKLKENTACNEVGLFYESDKDGEMAGYFYKKSCELKDAKACFKLGQIYEQGLLLKQNLKTSLHYYSKSCANGFGEACYLLGRYYEKEQNDISLAKRYFSMGCDKKHDSSCTAYKELNNQDIQVF